MRELEHSRPADIEAESFRIIGAELAERGIVLPADQAPLVKRAIHTTADFDYARNLVFTPGAVEAGVRALRAGTPILTDTNMARSGINRGARERLGISVHCFMAAPEVARRAAEAGTTRAAGSIFPSAYRASSQKAPSMRLSRQRAWTFSETFLPSSAVR